MLSHDRKSTITHRHLPENGADERCYPLSQKPLVTFVPFVVRDRS